MRKIYISTFFILLGFAAKAQNIFYVTDLNTLNPSITDHLSSTGDDRGGIAVTQSHVYYTGDVATAVIPVSLTGAQASTAHRLDAFVCNISGNGGIYSITNNGTPVQFFNNSTNVTINRLVQLDPLTLAPTTSFVNLSTPITFSQLGGNFVGLYSGPGYVIFEDNSDVYKVDLTNGAVTTLSTNFNLPQKQYCENGSNWGIAEYDGTNYAITYVKDINTIESRYINSSNVRASWSFTNLGDMCSIIVSPWNNRWYFNYEGNAQFGGNASNGETIGFANATYFGNLPLSISFTNIKAQQITKSSATINWTIKDNNDVQYFEVEKLNAKNEFEKIGELNADNSLNYSFIDNNATSEVNTYKVIAHFANGSFVTSEVVNTLNNFDTNNGLQVTPNPANAEIHIIIGDAFANNTIQIVDVTGKIVMQANATAAVTTLDVSTLVKGMYVVRIINSNGVESKKFLKN
jgi:hypothetical protein